MERCLTARPGRRQKWQVGLWLVIVAVCTAGATVTAAAATTASPEVALVRVTSLTIKPGKQAVFEAFVSQLRAAYVARGGGSGWQLASTELGEDLTYTAAFGFADWTELAPRVRDVMVEEYGAEAAATALANFAEAVVSQRSAVYRYLPAYSREPPAGTPLATLQANVIIDLKPSKVEQYLTALELVREARIQADSPAFWRVYAGSLGARNRLVIAYRISDWSALNDPPGPLRAQLVAAFGEVQAEKAMLAMEAAEAHVESRLMRARPELSYVPAD